MSTITGLTARVKDNVKDDHNWVSETAHVQAVKDAVIIYSKHRPIIKPFTLSLEANVSTYDLPADFLYFIKEPTIGNWLYPDSNVRVTTDGLIPIPTDISSTGTIRVQGNQIYVSPSPGYNVEIPGEYAARHVVSEPDEYRTLREDEDIIIVAITEAIVLKVMARRAAQEADYSEGDTRLQFQTRAKQYENLALKAENHWRKALGLSLLEAGS
jgi:hypothetical protein